jgi:hypothetical protein
MENGLGQFQIIILDSEESSYSQSMPGAWGKDITSSAPSGSFSTSVDALPVIILPRPNDSEVDPNTLKTTHD